MGEKKNERKILYVAFLEGDGRRSTTMTRCSLTRLGSGSDDSWRQWK